jgi:hypothetical protein
VGCPWQLSDDEQGDAQGGVGAVKRQWRKKGGWSIVGCSLYTLQKQLIEGKAVGGKMVVAAMVWMSSARSGHRRSDSEADEWAPHDFTIFQIIQTG